jgi:hypothetical protein
MRTAREMVMDESGQTLVLAALSMTVILGFLALSVDMGVMFCVQRSAQSAADSAAITGAQEIRYSDVTSAAKADSARNGYTDGSGGVTVTVNNPPANGPHSGNAGYVEVIVAKTQSTFFMNLFNFGSMIVKARAVATMGTTQNCVYALGSSGTDITVSGGADVEMPSCAIYGDSSGSSDLSINGGSTLNTAAINLVGNYTNTGGSSLTPTPTTGIAPVSDPLAYLSPPTFSPSSCLADPKLGGGITTTIGPSSGGTICYNGLSIGGGATATLNPGLYIINGAFKIDGGGGVSGAGVTFYLPAGASVSFNGGTVFTLTAPTSGTYNGILFYQDRSNSTGGSINGGATATLQGILYFPDANLTWNGGSATGVYASVVAGSLSFTGGTEFQNYAKVNRNTPLDGARIVE